MTNEFYDPLAPFYHLIHGDFEASITRQAAALDQIIQDTWGQDVRTVLDVTCGIGTQALGLAGKGYAVTGSDLSRAAIERARKEARDRELEIPFHVADMCQVDRDRAEQFDLVMSADNAVTHLLSENLILGALKSFHAVTRPGGGCLVSMRDYDTEEKGGTQFHPYGVRDVGGVLWSVYQVWQWREDCDVYDFSMYFTADDGGDEIKTHVMRSAFLALSPVRMMALFEAAGFRQVRRIDDVYFQPVITGTK